MSNSTKWISKLNDLCRALDEQYHINGGGCARIAYYIAQELQNRHITYSIKVYFCGSLSKTSENLLSNCPPTGAIDNHYWTHISLVVYPGIHGKTINPGHRHYSSVIIRTKNNLEWLRVFIDNHEFNNVYKTYNNHTIKFTIKKFFKNNLKIATYEQR